MKIGLFVCDHWVHKMLVLIIGIVLLNICALLLCTLGLAVINGDVLKFIVNSKIMGYLYACMPFAMVIAGFLIGYALPLK